MSTVANELRGAVLGRVDLRIDPDDRIALAAPREDAMRAREHVGDDGLLHLRKHTPMGYAK